MLFIDDLNRDKYSHDTCEVIIAVGNDGALSRCSNCEEEEFGRSGFTRSMFHCVKHLRTRHLIKLSFAEQQRAASAVIAAKKKAKSVINMRTGTKTGPPQHDIANNPLGFAVVSGSRDGFPRFAARISAISLSLVRFRRT